MKFRKVINKLHLWLGLASGTIIFLIALTGALWTFETEIQDALYSYRNVKEVQQPFIAPSQLKTAAASVLGDKKITGIYYRAKNKAAEVRAWSNEKGNEYDCTVFLNPYTGELLHAQLSHNFFDIVIELHTNLMLGDAGRTIIDYSALLFLIMLISGIILWWPRNKARRKTSYRIKWNATFKRKNYDLHNVFGFYASWVLLFIVLTGLAWGFEWVNKGLYNIAGGGAAYKDWPSPVSNITNTTADNIDDRAFQSAIHYFNQPYEAVYINYPRTLTGAIAVYVYPSSKLSYNTNDYYFDQYTGLSLVKDEYAFRNGGEQLRSMYYDIHIGKILGFPGQLLVFFASLIAASLPITGFLIWRGRNKSSFKISAPASYLNTKHPSLETQVSSS